MQTRIFLFWLSFFICIFSFYANPAFSSPDTLETKNIKKLYLDLTSNNSSTQRLINISDRLSIITELEGTSKGNGTIKILNLFLRIYDAHDDGLIYKDDILDIEVKDTNNDGYNDILISGVVHRTGEKETDPVIATSISFIYPFDCSTGLFKVIHPKTDYSPLIYSIPAKPIKCTK